MAYQRPSVNVYQEFTAPTTSTIPEMSPFIIGPRYDFLTYAGNKTTAYVGTYDKTMDNIYPYPAKNPISVVNVDSAKVYLDEAHLKYFTHLAGAGLYDFRLTSLTKNRIRTAGDSDVDELNFKYYKNAAGTEFPRSLVFNGRDVAIGDQVKISATVGATVYTTNTKVVGFAQDTIPATTGVSTADSGNVATNAGSVTVVGSAVSPGGDTISPSGTYSGDLTNDVLEDTYTLLVTVAGAAPVVAVPTADPGNTGDDTAASTGSKFDSLIVDTYTVEITTGGAIGVAEYTVTSTNGDDVAATVAAAFASPNAVGTKGVKIVWTDGGDTNLTIGDKWTILATPSTGRMSVTSSSATDNVAVIPFPGFSYAFAIGTRGVMGSLADGGDLVITASDSWQLKGVKQVAAVVATSSGTYTGDKNITYTAEVTQGGPWNTAEITVTSTVIDASGPTVITNFATPAIVGTKGVQISFATNVQGGLMLGDKWTIVCTAVQTGAYKTLVLQSNLDSAITGYVPTLIGPTQTVGVADEIAATSGAYSDTGILSTYRGETYTVEITTGGIYGAAAYTVTSSSGQDNQVSTIIPAASTPTFLGSHGLYIQWSGGDGTFVLGNKWTIVVNPLNLNVELDIFKRDYELPKKRLDDPLQDAWTWDSANVTVKDNLMISDISWESGTVTLPVEQSKVYVTYRALRPENTTFIDYVTSVDEIETKLGVIDPNNPLAYGVYKALQNAGTALVRFIPIETDDAAGYTKALEPAENVNNVYHFVPLTFDHAVHSIIKAHLNAYSTPSQGKWRRMICSSELDPIKDIYITYPNENTGEPEDYLATITDYPADTVATNIYVEALPNQGVDAVAAMRIGDVMRANYTIDSQGHEIYTEYTITQILSGTSWLIGTGPAAPVTIASKFTIVRPLAKSEQIDEFGGYAESLNDRRVTLVYPDWATSDDGNLVEGFYLAAAIAGMVAANYPNQGLTNMSPAGFTDASKASIYFTREQLDLLAESGVFIITQDTIGATPYIRHQLTTNTSTIEYQEQSICINVDSISYIIKAVLQPFIGVYNITDTVLSTIRTTLEGVIEKLKVELDSRIGGQLIDAVITRIEQDPVLKDQLRVDITATIPYPLNVINVYIYI